MSVGGVPAKQHLGSHPFLWMVLCLLMHLPVEHGEELQHGEGIELMSASNATSRAHSPKIGSDYTVVHVRASHTGTEITAGSTDGALTVGERAEDEDEDEEELGHSAEGVGLLQQQVAPGKPPFSCTLPPLW